MAKFNCIYPGVCSDGYIQREEFTTSEYLRASKIQKKLKRFLQYSLNPNK